MSEIMSFNLYRGEITSAPPEDLAFEVKFDSIDEKTMNFFIQFENSDMVSIDNSKDTLIITVEDVSFFTMIDEASVLDEGTIVTMKIPKQLS